MDSSLPPALSRDLPPWPITLEDALARLAEDEFIECRFEKRRHDNGVSFGYRFGREDVMMFLATAAPGAIMVSGPEGQKLDLGMCMAFDHYSKGLGLLFISTRPERRLSWSDIVSQEIDLSHRCPDCRVGRLLEGPRGGACVNVQCEKCGTLLNLTIFDGKVFHTERNGGIDGKSEGVFHGPLWP